MSWGWYLDELTFLPLMHPLHQEQLAVFHLCSILKSLC